VSFLPREEDIGDLMCIIFVENIPIPQPIKLSVVFPEPYLPLCKVHGLEPKVDGIT
jgi:hypothetical protein